MIRVFSDYLEVATAVVVYVLSWLNFSSCIDIVLIFFSYSGPSGVLGSDGKQNTAYAGARGRENCCTFHKFS